MNILALAATRTVLWPFVVIGGVGLLAGILTLGASGWTAHRRGVKFLRAWQDFLGELGPEVQDFRYNSSEHSFPTAGVSPRVVNLADRLSRPPIWTYHYPGKQRY